MSPANFAHPLLVAQKVVPQPVIGDEPKTDAPAVKSDKGADAGSAIKLTNSETNLELRPTLGHAIATPLREQTHTADASGAMPATDAAVTMSDASSSAAMPASNAEAKLADVKSEPVKSEAQAVPAKRLETASSDNRTAEVTSPETRSPEAATDEVKSVDVNSDEVKTGTLKADAAKGGVTRTDVTKSDAPKAAETIVPKAAEKPVEPTNAAADAPAVAPDARKDPSRLPGAEKAAAKAEPPKRTGQISAFVSRKDGKLYVRQNFAPLFEVPVTIAPSERMLGTHVFTAEVDKNDPNKLRWSVVSLPVTARNATRNEDDDRSARRRKVAGGGPAEVKAMPAVNSATEALDRISIPPDAMARIAEALTTGGSIVVSDQGINQGETGEGTDFIVSLR
jgi:hypothetical protein